MPSFRKKSHSILLDFLEKLDRMEKTEFVMMAKSWSFLSSGVILLVDEISAKGNLSASQILMMDKYVQMQKEMSILSVRYASYNTSLISSGQEKFAVAGIESAQEMLNLSASFYKTVPVESVNRMIGMTSSGTPLNELLVLRYGENAQKASEILVESMALGRNPRETARLVGATLEGSVSDSIRIARTEQIFALREAQTASYIESGIVDGVDLVLEPDACEVCQAVADENPHELGYVVDTHPNCRCGLAPVILQ